MRQISIFVESVPVEAMKWREVEVHLPTLLSRALKVGEWSASRSDSFTSTEKFLDEYKQTAWWPPEHVSTL